MSSRQPLAGKRILITRARHQAGRLAEALEAQGAEVLRLPTIEIVPPETYAHLDAVLEVISGFDWLIVTSANGAAALADRMQFLENSAAAVATFAGCRHWSGDGSSRRPHWIEGICDARRVCGRGGGRHAQGKGGGQRVLLARAAVARDVIPEQLRQCGADIHVVEAYRTVIPADSIEQVRALFGEGKAAARRGDLHQLLNGEQFFCASRCRKDGAAAGIAGSLDRPGHHAAPCANISGSRHAKRCKYDIPGVVAACVKLMTGHFTS